MKGVSYMTSENTKVCAVTDAKLLDKLTGDAGVVCARCGAKAHDKSNVCEPVPFEPDH
jgi:hypothetical protein